MSGGRPDRDDAGMSAIHLTAAQALASVAELRAAAQAGRAPGFVLVGGAAGLADGDAVPVDEPLPALVAAALAVVLPGTAIAVSANPFVSSPAQAACALGNLHALTRGRTGLHIDLRGAATAAPDDLHGFLAEYRAIIDRLLADGPSLAGRHFQSEGPMVGPKSGAQPIRVFLDGAALDRGIATDGTSLILAEADGRDVPAGVPVRRLHVVGQHDTRPRPADALVGFRGPAPAGLAAVLGLDAVSAAPAFEPRESRHA